MTEPITQYFAPSAWVNDQWIDSALLTVAHDGTWAAIKANASLAERSQATYLAGPVIPGVVNAHSHAFQRAIAGMTERSSGQDNFWSWRDRMYTAALRITPEQLEAIATQLYAELLQAGYTQVCEFQYLHNDLQGQPYANPLEMANALIRAAQQVGIGITLLPTLYMRSGFAAKELGEDQRRFASTPEALSKLCTGVQAQFGDGLVNVGIALHSLRAAGRDALSEAAAFAQANQMPIHIHVAEQTSEVEDCIAHTGQRPVEWLLTELGIDKHWNLVHATHTTREELRGVQSGGASIVLCPSTEANLGDGVFDLPSYVAAQGKWSIGSDSHVTRSWQEELRLLEYSQRFVLRQRNVMATAASQGHGHAQTSTAAALFNAALAGGSTASGLQISGLVVGARADFSVIDASSAALLGLPRSHLLDALVFSSPEARLRDVFVAGKQVIRDGCIGNSQRIAEKFTVAMQQLWV